MSGRVYAVDPGTTHSALVLVDGDRVLEAVPQIANDALCAHLAGAGNHTPADVLVLEQVESMGMAVGREVFETVFWTGRFYEAWAVDRLAVRVTRRAVKLALCGSPKATDANIRRALVDLWGGAAAIGTRKDRGPLYAVKSHCWQALALAVTYRGMGAFSEVPPR